MTYHPRFRLKPLGLLGAAFAVAISAALIPSAASAQSSAAVRDNYPSLAELFNAFDVTQEETLQRIAEINANAVTDGARRELKMQLTMMSSMTMSEMMASGMGHGGMSMSMNSPYGDLEIQARMELLEQMRQRHSDSAAAAALSDSDVLDEHTSRILQRGREFESQLMAIYVDETVSNKQQAVAQAIQEYFSDSEHAVAMTPKDRGYLLEHPHATGFRSAFPLFSGFLWTQQWMRLAALEAVILENLDSQVSGGVDTVLERFWNKVGSSGGMSMFPAPSELPMTPAIAPDLYSQSPAAAIILDNLNVLKNVIADIIAYPNADDRQGAIEAAVARYTDKTDEGAPTEEYLLFALRGGIYEQGGPAVGELMQSERNRSRSAMDMQHNMIMSMP